MLHVVLENKDKKEEKTFDFDKDTVFLGRADKNDIVFPEKIISKMHAKISKINGGFQIVDQSTHGTFVNEKRLSKGKACAIQNGDTITIGNYHVRISSEEIHEDKKTPEKKTSLSHQPKPEMKLAAEEPRPEKRLLTAEEQQIVDLKQQIHARLIDYLDLRRADIRNLNEKELYDKTRETIKNILSDMHKEIPKGLDLKLLTKEILDEALGLGALEDLLADPEVNEIMVNNKDHVYIEKDGKLQLSDKTFSSNEAILAVIERIVAPIGRRIDESSPLVDARLKDGSRVNAIIPPLALSGPCITIRKFAKDALGIQSLIGFDTCTPEMAEFMKMCVSARQNIVISGGTGSGKTTTLNIISSFISNSERIVTIEDAAELQLPQEHVVSLETRPPNIEGKGAITIRDLVKNSLRMRPDRIVVGECRGGEALDMLQAMNTGHDGSLTTGHANSPRDILARLETMVLMAGMDLPAKAIREQIASAVNIIIQQTRLSCGSRKIVNICEITGMEGETVTLQDIFRFRQTGFDENGKTLGSYEATGFIPRFYDDMRRRGVEVNLKIFSKSADDQED